MWITAMMPVAVCVTLLYPEGIFGIILLVGLSGLNKKKKENK